MTWAPVANSSVSLPSISGSVLGGLAVTSHDPTKLSTVAFTTVTVG